MNVNKLLIFSLVLSMSYQASAQTGLSDELRDDLLGEYQEQPLSDEVNGELVEVSDVPIASPSQQVRFQQPQQQPTTYVEAEPLTDSKAERIRKLRQRAEINTEEKIVEKLESSRLKDEQKRAEKLFGNRLENQTGQHQAVHQPHQPQQQMVQVVPVEDKTSERDREDLRSEILDAVRDEINVSKEQEMIDTAAETHVPEDVYFATASFGFAEYSGISVPSDNSFGFGFGLVTAGGAVFEGGYSYSKFDLPDYRLNKLEQHNFNASLGYMFFRDTRVRPNIGVLGSYTLRKYSGKSYGYGYNYNNNDKDDSNAFDVGFVGGVDFEITNNFVVGFNYKYYVNVYNSQEGTCYYYNCGYNNNYIKESIESSDYHVFGVLSRFRF